MRVYIGTFVPFPFSNRPTIGSGPLSCAIASCY